MNTREVLLADLRGAERCARRLLEAVALFVILHRTSTQAQISSALEALKDSEFARQVLA